MPLSVSMFMSENSFILQHMISGIVGLLPDNSSSITLRSSCSICANLMVHMWLLLPRQLACFVTLWDMGIHTICSGSAASVDACGVLSFWACHWVWEWPQWWITFFLWLIIRCVAGIEEFRWWRDGTHPQIMEGNLPDRTRVRLIPLQQVTTIMSCPTNHMILFSLLSNFPPLTLLPW